MGGALFSHSPVWAQMFADALGQPVTLAAEVEASSRGAALLAMEAAGILPSTEEAEARLGQTFAPDPTRHPRYQELLSTQQKYYIQLSNRKHLTHGEHGEHGEKQEKRFTAEDISIVLGFISASHRVPRVLRGNSSGRT